MKKRKKRMSNGTLGLIFLGELIVLLLMIIGYAKFYIDMQFDKIQYEELDEENLSINEGSNPAQSDYKLIALFGIDARDNTNMGTGNRSDSIMIAAINKDTDEVKIVSLYRDTLLNVDYDGGFTTKITHAYAYGGPELAIKTLNENLDLQITDFVTVNFLALTKAIDELGGVTVHVEEDELPVLNTSIAEQVNVTGIYSDGVFETGELRLNGTQATAYARIRSTGMGDITRTERQREVLSAMFSEAKSAGLSTIDNILDEVFPLVYTSISKDEMIKLAEGLLKYELSDNAGFPFTYEPVSHASKGSIIVAADLSTNVTKLHEFLFGTVNYVPTDRVKELSDQITNETGVTVKE